MGVFVFDIQEKLFGEIEQLLKGPGHHADCYVAYILRETEDEFVRPCKENS